MSRRGVPGYEYAGVWEETPTWTGFLPKRKLSLPALTHVHPDRQRAAFRSSASEDVQERVGRS
jgi:hypothetical protein